jgi:hypothetical protein
MKKIFIATFLLFLAIGIFADDHINTLKIDTVDGAYLIVLDHILFVQITNNHKDLIIYFSNSEYPIHFVYSDADGPQRLFDQIQALLNQKPLSNKKGQQ